MASIFDRRTFLITAALAPFAAHAQLFGENVRKLAVLMGDSGDDPMARGRFFALVRGLATKGWGEGVNLKVDVRWTEGDPKRAAQFAAELAGMQPEVIVTHTAMVTAAVLRETRSTPVVFTVVSDPVGSGFVQTLARPGGNATGLTNIEPSLAEKWVELLPQVAPKVRRLAVMYNPKSAPYTESYLPRLNAAAARLGLTSFISTVTSPRDIEEVAQELGRDRGASGLIVMTDSFMFQNRKTIVAATARRKVPAVYYEGQMVAEGGLVSYGVEVGDLFSRASAYVDRILRGAKPADIPVEPPARFELCVNARTAKALKLAIPQSVLSRADKVIG